MTARERQEHALEAALRARATLDGAAVAAGVEPATVRLWMRLSPVFRARVRGWRWRRRARSRRSGS
jgi:hypothetical protein